MGIRGLERYLEQNNRDACYVVNVEEAILDYKKTTGKSPKIVIDGISVMRYLYTKNFQWIFGGHLREFCEVLREFITRFINLGAELIIFFDGPPEPIKRGAWVRRRLQKLSVLSTVFDDLSLGEKIHSTENCMPQNLGLVLLHTFNLYGCKVYKSILECDKEMASYALKNDCLAILAQDTDFVIFQGAKYYWSLKNLNLNTMTTYNYDRIKFAKSLRLTTGHLPLVASLMGNDISSYDLVLPFKRRLLRHNSGRNIDFSACLLRVSAFVRRYPVGIALNNYLPQIAQEVFLDENKATLLHDSIMSYDLIREIKDIKSSSGNSVWDAVLKLTVEIHKYRFGPSCVYNIVMHQRHWATESFEDLRNITEFPAVQEILKKLRQHIYGILLMEKPLGENKKTHEVRELVVTSLTSLNKDAIVPAVPPAVKHPGLLVLWDENDKSIHKERWDLVADALQVRPNSVDQLPPHLIVPTLSLIYLLKNGLSISKWEINAILASNIVLKELSIESLKSLPKKLADVRAIRIQTIVTGTYNMIIILLHVCGNPLDYDYVLPTNYEDGQLFHLKYEEAKNGSSISKLLNDDVHNIETFNIIYNYISTNTN